MSDLEESKKLILKANMEQQLLEHYQKTFRGMVRWALYEQEPILMTVIAACKIDPHPIAVKALESVLEEWRNVTAENAQQINI